MGRHPIGKKAMTDAERQRRSRARRGRAPMVTLRLDEKNVVEVARQAGPEAMDALWLRNIDRAKEAITVLDLLLKAGGRGYRGSKPQASINAAWKAIDDLDGTVVFGDEE
jgi:hypothetical protein